MRTLGPRLRTPFAALLLALAAASPAVAEAPVNSYLGVAIYGYDAVAYFRQGKALRGSYRFGYLWSGALWLFLTPQNQANFMVNPERYAPQYGGYSAFGILQGRFYGIDPNAFMIADGKLYLHANHHVMRQWREALDANIATADAQWQRLLRERERRIEEMAQ